MNNIKYYRKQRGIRQKDLAQKLFISTQTLYAWESERRCPNVLDAVKLAKALDVSLDDLFLRGTESEAQKEVSHE